MIDTGFLRTYINGATLIQTMAVKDKVKTYEESINELEKKIAQDPSPNYYHLLDRLKKIRDEPEYHRKKGGFKGYGVS